MSTSTISVQNITIFPLNTNASKLIQVNKRKRQAGRETTRQTTKQRQTASKQNLSMLTIDFPFTARIRCKSFMVLSTGMLTNLENPFLKKIISKKNIIDIFVLSVHPYSNDNFIMKFTTISINRIVYILP